MGMKEIKIEAVDIITRRESGETYIEPVISEKARRELSKLIGVNCQFLITIDDGSIFNILGTIEHNPLDANSDALLIRKSMPIVE